MNKAILFLAIALSTFLFACKTSFEKVRESGDPVKIYEEATKYYDEGDYLRAQMLYELAIPNYRGKKEAEEIFYRYADTHFQLEKFLLATHYYERFGASFPNSEFKEKADFNIAMANYLMSPRTRLDQTYSEKAIESFQAYANMYPESERLQNANILIDELRRKLEEKAFDSAEMYFNQRKYTAAIQSFENLLKDFPETPDAEKVRFLIIKSDYLLAANSVRTKQSDRYAETLKVLEKFKKKYPESSFLPELNKLADIANKELKSL